MEKLLLIDGNSIAFRAFFALPPLSNSQGLHTNAILGFTNILLRLIEEQKPTHFLVAFDAGKVTFRHAEYKDYKGGRAKTPSELSEQFPVLRELLRAFNIAQLEMNGYEADDIIGTLTRLADEQKMEVVVVSGDKDMLQLVSDHVTVALTIKGISQVELYDPAKIQARYGLVANQIIDLKGLMGDASDNIPGIPGVGEKTALKLLHQYGTVEEVLLHAEEVPGKIKGNIIKHAEDAKMSKALATIIREVPIELKLEDIKFVKFDAPALTQLFRKLEFKQIMERMNLTGTPNEDVSKEHMACVIVDEVELPRFIQILSSIEALHIEIAGDNPHAAKIIGLSFFAVETCYYLPFETLLSKSAGAVKEWLADDQIKKQMYDVHRAELALHWRDISLKGVQFDVLLAAYLLDPTESSLTLSGLTQKYALPVLAEGEEIFGKGAKFHIPEISKLSEYMCRKVTAIQRLIPLLKEDLLNSGMTSLFEELELPLAGVLAEMEKKGILVNTADLQKLGVELGVKLDKLVLEIYEQAGTEFNIGSPKQLGDILFEKLGLPVIKKIKTGYSTDAEVLEKLEPYHNIISLILLYRQLAKLQSTYVEGLIKEIRKDTNKVHTFYHQTIAATGRLSSQFPNLQNIPIRLEEGRKIRKVFVPRDPSWYILSADYSQIELRVLAHISQDENMMEAFLNDIDVHTKTAMDVFGVTADQVDSNMRRQAKAVNFGIVYGISDYGLSQNLHITRKEAAAFIEQYFAVFKGVRTFMDDVVKQAREDGYVTTLLQRRRYLPEIKASNFNLRSFAERTAMNSPIQGTAADIIKLAMVQISARMDEAKLKSHMLLQVHDELVFEVPEDELEIMKKLVPEVMENAISLSVPLKADVSYGKNWYEAK